MMLEIIYDTEVYPNKLCIGLFFDNKIKIIDKIHKIRQIPFEDKKYKFIGFNCRRYDHPILEAVKGGLDERGAYELSQQIIQNKTDAISWSENIIDILEICPKMSKCSLKEFGHRLKYPILQNLPYRYDKVLSEEEWKIVKKYCSHDLKITRMLWEKLREEYDARQSLKSYFDIKTEYGGAPRLAEKAILSKLGDNRISYGRSLFKMDNLKLSSQLQNLYDEAFSFNYDDFNPSFMSNKIDVNGCLMNIQKGGLHGNTYTGVYENVYDYDVTSYYPSIILACKIGSSHFRSIYKQIYDLRVSLKAKKLKGANALKLVLNSLYGKFNDKYADKKIYAPHVALSICLLGQFYLLDLIEKLDYEQCLVANTDGIICSHKIKDEILEEWETRTGFKLTCTQYKKIIIKDVNSYYAVDMLGNEKRKKEFLDTRWTHNVKAPIIQEAVISELNNMMTIPEIIENANNIYDFCYFSKVQKGGKLLIDNKELDDPKVRYFIAKEGHILERVTEKTRVKIVKNHKIKMAMNLDNHDCKFVNREYYIQKANELKERIFKNERRPNTDAFHAVA